MSAVFDTADRLARAYEQCIEAEHALLDARLKTLARDVRETRNLVWVELLNLYLNSNDDVRTYLHSLGIGGRLLQDAQMMLRAEGERRRRAAVKPTKPTKSKVEKVEKAKVATG